MREPRWRRYLRFWRSNPTRDVDDELSFHFARRVEEFEAGGATRDEAVAEACERFGNLTAVRTELVDIDERVARRRDVSLWLDNATQDLRYAFRALRHQRAFAAAVVFTLGLAVGVNLTVLSLVDAIFLRPPAGIDHPALVRRVYTVGPSGAGERRVGQRFSYAEFRSIQAATQGVARVAIDFPIDSTDVGFGASTTIAGVSYASAELLPMLGVRMERGRAFSESDDDVNSPSAVAVVSRSFAKRVFGDSVDPLDATIRVRNQRFRVIGLAAQPFAGLGISATSVWIPFSNQNWNVPRDSRPWYALRDLYIPIVVRLLPGVSAAAFEARATTAFQRARDPKGAGLTGARILAAPLQDARGPGEPSREEAIASRIAAVAVLLFVIACANVANLLLARSWTRRREFAVRTALGISPARLAMLVFLEALVLSVLAGLVALMVGHWGGSILRTQILPRVRWPDVVLTPRIVVLAALITCVAALLAGAAPALIASRSRNGDVLKSGTQHGSARRSRLRSALIILQSALAVVLVVGAVLFDKSLRNVRGIDLGYDSNRLVVGSVYFPDRQRHPDRGARLTRIAARIGNSPGVAGAVATYGAPTESWIEVPMYRMDADSGHAINEIPNFIGVGPDYFRITGTQLLAGRAILASDRAGSEPVIVVSEAMAQQLWPQQPAIGQCLKPVAPSRPCYRVVGIAKEAHEFQIINATPEMQYYYPLEQVPTVNSGPTTIIVRAGTASPDDVANTLRAMLRETFPGAEPRAISMSRAFEPQMRPWILGARIFAALSAMALLVAVIGVYAMASFEARQRTREIGVRIALGAQSVNVIALLVRQGTAVVGIGVVVGTLIALAAGRFVSSVLFGVSPSDPSALIGASGILLLAAGVASFAPSWRATRVDPSVVLRDE